MSRAGRSGPTRRERAATPFALDLGDRRLELGGGVTRVMGVVNVTPDSFHPASRTPDPEEAVARALQLASEGAAVLDVGGESTRPGARPIDAAEEIGRVLPVIERLAARTDVPIAIDTYKAEVARRAVEAGAKLVNDVSGGLLDPEMPAMVAALRVPVVVGHLRGTPATMQRAPFYADPVAEVRAELAARLDAFAAAGVARARLLVDPGIGFGKRGEDNVALLAGLRAIATLGHPVVVGVSRKRFLSELLLRAGIAAPDDSTGRLEASLAAAVLAAAAGVCLVRTHDVAATRRSLAIADAILHQV